MASQLGLDVQHVSTHEEFRRLILAVRVLDQLSTQALLGNTLVRVKDIRMRRQVHQLTRAALSVETTVDVVLPEGVVGVSTATLVESRG